MIRIIALLPDARARNRLAAAIACRERLWHPVLELASGWPKAGVMALASAPDLLVFDPYAGGSFDGGPILGFTERFPSCVLFGYGTFPRGCAGDVLELSRAGVHGVATRDMDDLPEALARLLDRTLEHGTLTQAVSLLERRMPPAIRDLLPGFLFRAHGSFTPSEVARFCHCHPKTLGAHLRHAGLPSLGKLIVWARLIRACHLLRGTGRSVESVALVLGFASANSFRNQLLRYVGIRPTDLRKTGDFRLVLGRFEDALGPPAGGGREPVPQSVIMYP